MKGLYFKNEIKLRKDLENPKTSKGESLIKSSRGKNYERNKNY